MASISHPVLERALAASELAETVSNYARADEPLQARVGPGAAWERGASRGEWTRGDEIRGEIHGDEELWREVLGNAALEGCPERFSSGVRINCAAVSDWVARVPGLYWQAGSAPLRRSRQDGIESRMGGWKTYRPPFKTMMVRGGVGTLKLPPADDGFRLVTVTMTLNASAGIPALVAPDVWNSLALSEGALIRLRARWRAMPLRWAEQFPVVAGIPRGCLVLDVPNQIEPFNERAPVMVHPFSVMEYWDGSTLLHDFVFATADTRDRGFRLDLERFFEEYRKANGRDGSYLLAADVAEPMWDAVFASPAEMRASRTPQLRLIERRAEEAMNGQSFIEALLRNLSSVGEHADLARLSTRAGIPPQRWKAAGISLAEQAARLVDVAVESKRQQALLQAVVEEFQQ